MEVEPRISHLSVVATSTVTGVHGLCTIFRASRHKRYKDPGVGQIGIRPRAWTRDSYWGKAQWKTHLEEEIRREVVPDGPGFNPKCFRPPRKISFATGETRGKGVRIGGSDATQKFHHQAPCRYEGSQ